jgi:tight adherence protein B
MAVSAVSALAALGVLLLAWWLRPAAAHVRLAGEHVPAGGPRLRGGGRGGRRDPSAGDWAALLDRMSAEVRIGASLPTAFAQAMAAGPVAGRMVRPGATIASLADPAVVSATGAVSDDEVLTAHAICTAHALGGPVAATLDATAAQLRERVALRAEAQVHSAQARLSARVLTAVPVVFCLWNVATSASVRQAWLGPVGTVCALLGGGLNLIGWWWMRRIVGRATP